MDVISMATMLISYIWTLIPSIFFIAGFFLVLEMIKFLKKLNGISFYDVRYIIKMARDEFREPNCDSEED